MTVSKYWIMCSYSKIIILPFLFIFEENDLILEQHMPRSIAIGTKPSATTLTIDYKAPLFY